MPRRRCVGCGRVAPKAELLRIAAVPSTTGTRVATADPAARLPGRGAYLCRDRAQGPAGECLQTALRRRALARALRAAVTVDPKLVESVGR